jgi:hypothetical protein
MVRVRALLALSACFIVFASSTVVQAQVGLNPAWLDEVMKMNPGQSIERGGAKLTLNQRNAGSKDGNGWYLAPSVAGGFSARFPTLVNEVTVTMEAVDGPDRVQLLENVLLSETSTTRFMLGCLKTGELKATAQNIDEVVKMVESHWTQFKSEPFTGAAHAGIQFSGIDEQGFPAAGQSFLLDDRFCQFLVVGFGKPFAGIPPDARTFFASFRPVPGPKL